jgi:methionyl-tRNA synthetase
MYVGLQIAAVLAIASAPFLPKTAVKLKRMLGLAEDSKWSDLDSAKHLPAGHEIQPPELLFEKIEDSIIEEQLNKLNPSTE